MSQLFTVLLGCALNMMLSTILALELMTLLLGLGAPGPLKMTPCPLNVQISLILASLWISASLEIFGEIFFSPYHLDFVIFLQIIIKIANLDEI